MSVATQHSPFAVGSKRLYESEENEDRLQRLDSSANTHKRFRQRGSPSGRCGSDDPQHSYAFGSATVAALRALFPEMSDKVISDVLADYGDNIDAAIKHLTELRLTAAGSAAAGRAAAAAAEQQEAAQQPPQQQAAQQAQQQQEAGPPAPASAPSASDEGPRSAEEWVEVVVREMAAASDLADARSRASKVLRAFEQAALRHVHAAGDGEGAEGPRLRGQLAEAQRENQLLKRAVAIQNARMQELSGKEAEVAQLQRMLEGFQQKVHALEVQNYTLAMHLKQATDSKDALAAAGFRGNPDIF